METKPNDKDIPVPTARLKITVSAGGQPVGGFKALLYWLDHGAEIPASETVVATGNPPAITFFPNTDTPPDVELRADVIVFGQPWAVREQYMLGHFTHDRDVHFVLLRGGA